VGGGSEVLVFVLTTITGVDVYSGADWVSRASMVSAAAVNTTLGFGVGATREGRLHAGRAMTAMIIMAMKWWDLFIFLTPCSTCMTQLYIMVSTIQHHHMVRQYSRNNYFTFVCLMFKITIKPGVCGI
jgi:hypothetical protein